MAGITYRFEAVPTDVEVRGDDRAIDVNPAIVLTGAGIPVKLAEPGSWAIDSSSASIKVSYSSH